MAEAPQAVPVRALRILLVDDHADTRAMYGTFLERAGFVVAEARDGREALDKATSAPPDVIVTDLSLPVMDGFELCDRLRRQSRTAGVPVVALTGLTEPETVQRAQSLGVASVLTKPCMPDALVAEVERVRALHERLDVADGWRKPLSADIRDRRKDET
jgi:CheY-like chemotaxis protein